MSTLQVSKNVVNVTAPVRILDATTGAPATGITAATSGLGLYYQREREARVAVTPVALSGATDAHTDGGFLELGDGWYRYDVPDAAFVENKAHALIGLTLAGHVAFAPTALIEAPASLTGQAVSDVNSIVSFETSAHVQLHTQPIDDAIAALSASVAALNDLSAAEVRAALGLAEANLDTQLAALPTATANADAVGALVVEGAISLLQAHRAYLAALVGRVTGADTNAPRFRDQANTKDRIAATTDASGNRSAVTLDLA